MPPFNVLIQMALRSIPEPRATLRQVLGFEVSNGALLQISILFVVLTMIMQTLAELFLTPAGSVTLTQIFGGPLIIFAVQLGSVLIMAVVMYWAGGIFGGEGDFEACFKTAVWFSFIVLLLQAAQFATSPIPPIAALIMLFSLGYMAVALVTFTMEVHGFQNAFLVALGILGAIFAVGFVMAIILTLLGVGANLEELANA